MSESEMGELMKRLRIERNLTLEEVGNRVGVGKSTVRKWESGEIANMKRDKIALVAKALGVTPAALMGWEDPEPPPIELSEDERTLIVKYRLLDKEQRKRVMQIVDISK